MPLRQVRKKRHARDICKKFTIKSISAVVRFVEEDESSFPGVWKKMDSAQLSALSSSLSLSISHPQSPPPLQTSSAHLWIPLWTPLSSTANERTVGIFFNLKREKNLFAAVGAHRAWRSSTDSLFRYRNKRSYCRNVMNAFIFHLKGYNTVRCVRCSQGICA